MRVAAGRSGAGRKATEEFSFMELEGDFRAYKTLKHQHTPEIAQTLETVAGKPVSLVFTAHLLPVKRGILATAVCPGFVATDLNNFAGTRTVEQGARAAVRMALLDDAGPTGTFSDEDGPVPW